MDIYSDISDTLLLKSITENSSHFFIQNFLPHNINFGPILTVFKNKPNKYLNVKFNTRVYSLEDFDFNFMNSMICMYSKVGFRSKAPPKISPRYKSKKKTGAGFFFFRIGGS